MGEFHTIRCLCYQIVVTSECEPLILVINIDPWIPTIKYLCYRIFFFFNKSGNILLMIGK